MQTQFISEDKHMQSDLNVFEVYFSCYGIHTLSCCSIAQKLKTRVYYIL